MKINVNDVEKLAEAIAKAEGKATARTVTVENILDTLKEAESCIPKVRLKGTKVYYDGGQKFPNAYKHIPYSTHWEAVFTGKNWFVTDIWRDVCPNRTASGYISYTEAAKEYILQRVATI